MEVQLTRRPATSCCRRLLLLSPVSRTSSPSGTAPARLPWTAAGAARHKSSTSRTKRALNIPPHPSFLSPTGAPALSNNMAVTPGSTHHTHIIFNPPSSAPSVYHTPFKFLPRSDPRRRAQLSATLFASSTTIQYNNPHHGASSPDGAAAATSTTTPEAFPVVRPEAPKLYHLSEADVAEMRRLRAEDPVTNSVTALATRFGCAKLFVMMCCTSSREHRDKMREAFAEVRSRWGPRKAKAYEDRRRRWEMMLQGEL